MNCYVIIVALTVSIDSFFCGISLIKKTKVLLDIIKIISVVLVMCLTAYYLGNYLTSFFNYNLELIGGIIFILIAVLNLFSKEKNAKTSYCLGFAIGLDGSCATFSLAIMNYKNFLIPLIVTFFHLIFLVLPLLLSKVKFIDKICENKIIAPLVLTLLGLYKIIFSLL